METRRRRRRGAPAPAPLFACPACRATLRRPVTAACGHTFCRGCAAGLGRCPGCRQPLAAGGAAAAAANVLLQDLVEKWERAAEDMPTSSPPTLHKYGVEPRYHLRSRYAGFQLTNHCDRNSRSHLEKVLLERFPRKRRKTTDWGSVTTEMSGKENYENINMGSQNSEDVKESAKRPRISPSDLECILCSRCLLDPVTTDCGHTFCRECLTRVLDHRLACPLCMAALRVSDYSRRTTEVLERAIRRLAPREYGERLRLSMKEASDRGSELSVFVCTNAFPGVACPLYVSEPRYRLLARRCLSSRDRRFAMASRGAGGGGGAGGDRFAAVGTVLEVRDAVRMEDGRFILSTVGVRRYKVLSGGEQDGYDTAKVHYIKDAAVSPERLPELTVLHQRVRNKAVRWLRTLKPKVLLEVERLIGQMPKVEENWTSLPDGPSWTWWLMPILPLSSQLQIGFLSTTSLEKRLRAIDKMLEHMKIKMMALERKTVTCPAEEDTSDSCVDSERNYEMQFNE